MNLPGVLSLEDVLRTRLHSDHLLLTASKGRWQCSIKNRHGAYSVAIDDDPVIAILLAIRAASLSYADH